MGSATPAPQWERVKQEAPITAKRGRAQAYVLFYAPAAPRLVLGCRAMKHYHSIRHAFVWCEQLSSCDIKMGTPDSSMQSLCERGWMWWAESWMRNAFEYTERQLLLCHGNHLASTFFGNTGVWHQFRVAAFH
jgi:hypothetical protein